jgi:hypothetical protein
MTRSRQKVRPVRVEGDVAFVPLSNGQEAIIDAADLHLVDGWNWAAKVRPWTTYAGRTAYDGNAKTDVKLHRIILGASGAQIVDHKNGNGLDNRRTNLRIVTASQNAQNAAKRKDNSSGCKGVGFHKKIGLWEAYINASGKRLNLGYHASPEQANAAYLKASAEMHGEFGRAV